MPRKKKSETPVIENTYRSLLKMGFHHIFSRNISGRISRGQLWISDSIVRLWMTFIAFLDLALFDMPILFFVILLLWLIKTIMLMVQRLNDLDLNPVWMLVALGIIIFCLLVSHIVTYILLIILLIWFQIYLYAIQGTEWSNEFGVDPLESQPEDNTKYYIIVGVLLTLVIFFWVFAMFFLGGLEWMWLVDGK